MGSLFPLFCCCLLYNFPFLSFISYTAPLLFAVPLLCSLCFLPPKFHHLIFFIFCLWVQFSLCPVAPPPSPAGWCVSGKLWRHFRPNIIATRCSKACSIWCFLSIPLPDSVSSLSSINHPFPSLYILPQFFSVSLLMSLLFMLFRFSIYSAHRRTNIKKHVMFEAL